MSLGWPDALLDVIASVGLHMSVTLLDVIASSGLPMLSVTILSVMEFLLILHDDQWEDMVTNERTR